MLDHERYMALDKDLREEDFRKGVCVRALCVLDNFLSQRKKKRDYLKQCKMATVLWALITLKIKVCVYT